LAHPRGFGQKISIKINNLLIFWVNGRPAAPHLPQPLAPQLHHAIVGPGPRNRRYERGRELRIETDEASAIHEAETELRHLRKTIHALRDELELQEARKSEAVQLAVAEAHDELTQLRGIARALREELEAMQVSNREAVQKAVAESAGEIAELKRTVAALRDQMEHLRSECDDKLQDTERAARDELKHLQDTIAALRADLEKRP
jgi:chromosome segregation ATPase